MFVTWVVNVDKIIYFVSKRPKTCLRIFIFQMGGWRHRSLIDDAKFETVANQEFEKRERSISHGEIPENDDVIAQNGGHPASALPEGQVIVSYVIRLKEGLGSASRILRHFEVREYMSE